MKVGFEKHRDEKSLLDKGNFLYEGPEEQEYKLLSRHGKKFIRAMKMAGELLRDPHGKSYQIGLNPTNSEEDSRGF